MGLHCPHPRHSEGRGRTSGQPMAVCRFELVSAKMCLAGTIFIPFLCSLSK